MDCSDSPRELRLDELSAEEQALVLRWEPHLPPIKDLSLQARQWMQHPTMHQEWRQAALEPMVLQENCMMMAIDSKPNDAKKRYAASGFECFWTHYEPIVHQAARGIARMEELKQISENSTAHKSSDEPDIRLKNRAKALELQMDAAKKAACAASYYELTVPGRPCHLVFDIEYYNNEYNKKNLFENLVEKFLKLLALLFHEYYGLDDIQQHWQEVWTDSSNEEKISRHLVIHLPCQLMMADMLHCGALTRRLACLAIREYGEPKDNPLFVAGENGKEEGFEANNDTLVAFWDPLIYTRWRALRMVGSSKSGKYRYFWPMFYWGFQKMESSDEFATFDSGLSPCWRGTVEHITREFMQSTLVHSPTNRPHLTRVLYAREPDERECFSTTLLPTHRGRNYVLKPHMVGQAGSIPQRASITHFGYSVGGDNNIATHTTNANSTFIHHPSTEDLNSGGWLRFKALDRTECSTETQSSMVLLLLDVCDALVQSLNLEPEPDSKAGTPGYPMAQYYRINAGSRCASVQVLHHYCPIANKSHETNHMRYMIELQPRGQLLPHYRPHCYKCQSSRKDRVPVTFWNKSWYERLEQAEQNESLLYQRKAEDLFGFLGNVLWASN